MDNMKWSLRPILLAGLVASGVKIASPAPIQEQQSILDRAASIEIQPSSLTLKVGEKARLNVTVKDKDGNTIPAPVIFLSRSRRNVGVQANGEVEAYRPGRFVVVAMVPRGGDQDVRNPDAEGIRAEVAVTIPVPPLERLVFKDLPKTLFAGATIRVETQAYDTTKTLRRDAKVQLKSSNPAVASTDPFGHLTARQAGTVTLAAEAESVREEATLNVVPNPIRSIELKASQSQARTGDVIHFVAVAKDDRGKPIAGIPFQYAVQWHPDGSNPAAPATAQVDGQGRFVAEQPGQYTVIAWVGTYSATSTVEVRPRDMQQKIELVGHAAVEDRHTSDFWVWQGVDGRDYAITGTWGADGHAYFWDVTDPKNMKLVDTVRVDARTVNDVKISEDGRIAVISREGASNRRNGIVILDVSNPAEVRVLSRFDDQLTGGVHNVFIHKNHVYAVNNGRRFDIINIAEPKIPYRVARFELDTLGHAIHDVWVVDGIAYSSNWQDGVQLIDVGNGVAGGSPEKPVKFTSYADPKGHNHAAFPFKSKSTGKFYVIMGDEIFPYGLNLQDQPTIAAGYLHFVDFTDPKNPVEIARFEVPGAGTHNFWIEGDTLYVGYYNGGVRVVDISGELMGDLYRQGREIAWFLPNDPTGKIRNAPMVWGAQPYKGLIFFSDWNSGLWAVRLLPKEEKKGLQ